MIEPEPTDHESAAADPLGFEVERLRTLGHSIVDLVADHWAELDTLPAVRTASSDGLSGLGGPVPREPGSVEEAIALLADDALMQMQHAAHPRYFARVPSPASYTGILGDWLGVGFNAIAASWAGGSGPTQLELTVVDWLRELLGFPAGTEGLLVSGGSLGNATALATARAAGFDGAVYISDQTHSSITRDLRALGFGEEQIRLVPATDRFRWNAWELTAAIAADRAQGAIVVATAGTTNTGAVDPLAALADLCAARDLWLHVDGAYGAPAALAPSGHPALVGLERADSLTVDPHKWLFQPYDIGCVLVRRPGALQRCYAVNPEYLHDVRSVNPGEVDLGDYGFELSRRARATKLWLTFRTHGSRRIAGAIERSLVFTERVQRWIEADPYWELVTPAQLAVICFAARELSADEHRRRALRMTHSGFAAVSCTELDGRAVYRLCLINPLTTEDDVRETLRRLRSPHEAE